MARSEKSASTVPSEPEPVPVPVLVLLPELEPEPEPTPSPLVVVPRLLNEVLTVAEPLEALVNTRFGPRGSNSQVI